MWPTGRETILLSPVKTCRLIVNQGACQIYTQGLLKAHTSSSFFVFHSILSIPIPSMTTQHSELAVRVLQDVSANIQRPPRESKVKLQIIVPSPVKPPGRECTLTNDAGDHVIRHQHFYQLTEVERHNYNTLVARAYDVPSYVRYRGNQGQKTKGNQDVWDDAREELFFKCIVMFRPA